VPSACHVPPSWFHTTSTAYSTLPAAGLLHPATDPGVHPRFFRGASTCRPTTEVTVRDLDTRPLPSRRGSYPTKSFPRQQPYRITAAVALLPFTPPEGMTPPVTPVAERPSQRRLETCSTSRRYSTDESVAACGRCRQHAARSFHGLGSPSRSVLVRSARPFGRGSSQRPKPPEVPGLPGAASCRPVQPRNPSGRSPPASCSFRRSSSPRLASPGVCPVQFVCVTLRPR
jgi:hypothetical protein